MVASSGISFWRKVCLVSPSPVYVEAEKITPLALEVAIAFSNASMLSFSSKVTTATPALMAPIWVTMDSAVFV